MWLYNILINIYTMAVNLASRWNPKAKLWHQGRVDIFERMAATIPLNQPILWIHVASLGEFEQGRPLIEKLREEGTPYKILLTFFSPSGYELRKDYPGADYIFYLPADTPTNAKRFVEVAHPDIAIFVKYEFWLNLLFELRRAKVRTFIISSIFRQDSIFFRPNGALWRRALESFETIFVQNEESKELLHTIGHDNVVVAGDTRFDRVAEIAAAAKSNAIIERFKGSGRLFLAGSTWPADEELLLDLALLYSDTKFVIAPHEIGSERVAALEAKFPHSIRYTSIDEQTPLERYRTIILDTMGQLSSIYRYASWAYIGGGFGVGIHNTLEAAIFGIPIAFGTNYKRFREAVDMVEIGVCTSVGNAQALIEWFKPLIHDEEHYKSIAQAAAQYTTSQLGASAKILEGIVMSYEL